MKIRLIRHFLVFLGISLLLSSVLQASEVTLTDQDAGKTVVLKKGDSLVVQLASNRTTGYSWSLAISESGIVKQKGEGVYRPPQSKLIGAGGLEIWKFHAVETGSTKLTFSYVRPWEKGVPPANVIVWPITVQPS